ncbi:hypothetical protein DID88_004452 [Monilinia fructigena]|uniref:ABC transporter domain-containing protein n=1 Tax=Monilinia fructigena TaxID=38457 RepID=A0A395IQL5_9HELO|nr:hypothetical protein DID88_004452 [Monilinia fructigena]
MADSMTNSTCFFGGQPVTIQNATSWRDIGCRKGFYCPNNNDTFLPQYCPPNPACQAARLAGITCMPTMGTFELRFARLETTVLLEEKSKRSALKDFTVQKGHTKQQDVQLNLDVKKEANLVTESGTRRERTRKTFKKPGMFRGRGFAKIDDERSQVARKQSEIDMEERIMSLQRRPTGFEELGDMDDEFGCDVNGIAGDISKYKKVIGYVPQDDIVLPELTVRENILHSARIRLPCTWEEGEIQHHVDVLLACLQLSHIKDSLVGSTAAPVISGGQRKRVSIGMELAAAPLALFLDEPTSGLDATAANSIMKTLKALSRLGMTIVTVIHQPRQEIFESLDSLVLLGAGRMIYLGPQVGVKPHFEGLGFEFPEHGNPSDVMGDIIAGEGCLYKRTGDASIHPLIEHWQKLGKSSYDDKKGPVVSLVESRALSETIKTRGTYWYRQIWLCLLRSLLQQYRIKSAFFFELGVGALSGVLIGMAEVNKKGENFRGIFIEPYEMLSSSIDYISIPQMALLVGLAIGLTASAPGVKVFGEEKLVYWREAAAGHNRFSWVDMFAANLLYFWCIYGLASCVSMVTRREDGPLIAVMSSLIVGVLNGMSPSLEKVRNWHMVWLWRATPGTWLAEGYFTQNITPMDHLYNIESAKEVLGYNVGHFTGDIVMLFALGVAYRVVAFLGLRFMYGHKQR